MTDLRKLAHEISRENWVHCDECCELTEAAILRGMRAAREAAISECRDVLTEMAMDAIYFSSSGVLLNARGRMRDLSELDAPEVKP